MYACMETDGQGHRNTGAQARTLKRKTERRGGGEGERAWKRGGWNEAAVGGGGEGGVGVEGGSETGTETDR